MAKQEHGNCPNCNKRFALHAGRIPEHPKPGTRKTCIPAMLALPNTEYPKGQKPRIKPTPYHRIRTRGLYYPATQILPIGITHTTYD